MYNKVQANSRIPQLDKNLEKAQLTWADLAKEHATLAVEVRQVPNLEAKVDELKQTMAKLHSVHKPRWRDSVLFMKPKSKDYGLLIKPKSKDYVAFTQQK